MDVGGGIGSTAMLLAHTFPHLKFVIQDRPQVAEQGNAVRILIGNYAVQIVTHRIHRRGEIDVPTC